MVFRLKCQIFQQQRHLVIFFISFKIKPDVTFIDFTTKNRMFTPFLYQNCKNCKVVLPIRIWIWLKYSGNLLMCNLPTNGNLLLVSIGKLPFVGKLPIDAKGISGIG